MEAVRATAEGAIPVKAKQVKAFGAEAADAPLQQLNIRRRNPTSHDVEIEYCTAEFVTPIFTPQEMNGTAPFIPVYPVTKSLAKLYM
jgi:hypothetical protein